MELAFERRGERTVLARRAHDGPLVVQKALHPEGAGVCHAIVVHPPSGVAGGDELRLDATLDAGAHALLTTPGAGKWYRSAGPWASQDVRLDVRDDAILEWLPQETILYDGARARISWSASLGPRARLVAWDIFCLGRTGSGERFERGECRLQSNLSRGAQRLWWESAPIRPDARVRASAAGLAARPVFGTLLIAAPAIEPAWLQQAREARARDGEGAATSLPGVLVVRYVGESAEAAREYFGVLWRSLRGPVLGREPAEPRIWRT